MKLINIGFGNMVSANRLVAIVSPESAPIKRIIQDAKDRGTLIDATYGRRTRAVLVTDSDHVILSAVQPETVANRLNDRDEEDEEEIEENDLAICPRDADRSVGALRLGQGDDHQKPAFRPEGYGFVHLGNHQAASSGGNGRRSLFLPDPG